MFGQLTPTSIDNSASNSLRALAGLSNQVGDLAFQVGAKKAQKRGELEGARAGIDAAKSGAGINPDQGLLPSIFDESYNASMRASYVASIDNDNKEKFAEFASDHSTDLEGFKNKVAGYRKGVLENIDDETKLIIEQQMESDVSKISLRIREAEKQANLTRADEIQQIGITNNLDSSFNLAFDGDFEGANEKLQNALSLLSARLASGKISPTEHDTKRKSMINAVDIEANRHQFNKLLDTNNVSGVISFMQKVSDEKIKGKTPEQHRELLSILQSDSNNHFALIDKQEVIAKERRIETEKNNTEDLFSDLINGQLSASKVSMMMQQGAISLEQSKMLIGKLNTQGTGVDDHGLIIDINELMRKDPKKAKARIMENFGNNLTGDTSERLMNSANAILDDGGKKDNVLNSNKAKRFRAFVKKFAFDPGIGGFGSVENNKKLAQLELVFDERVLDGEEPAEVASDLIDFDEFLNLPQPRFGNNSEPEEAKEKLIELFTAEQSKDAGERTLSNDDFNREMLDLERAIELKRTSEEFKRAFDEALDGAK